MTSRVNKRVWKTLAILFGILAAVLVIITVILTISSNPPTPVPIERHEAIKWYHELHPFEIQKVLDFLKEKINITLESPQNARLNSSFVHYVELKLPIKSSIINYVYRNGPEPVRLAKTALFRGDLVPPVVEEYILWPLPNISSFMKSRTVPYNLRPILLLEIASLYKYILPKFEKATTSFIKEEYGMLFSQCMSRCVEISFSPVPSTVARKGRREIWAWLGLKSFYKVYPLDFQFEVDITNANPSEWTLGKVWFDSTLFNDTDSFLDYYRNKREPYTPWYRRKQSVLDSTNEFPERKPLPINPPPTNSQTQRYTITDNSSTVTYLKWKFHLQLSPTGGLRLLNIQYRGKLIVYEMNLQEVAVVYSGSTPAAQNLNFIDGTALFGSRMAGLVEGVDCPFGSTFLSPTIYTVNDGGFRIQHNSTCIFEHDSQVPLRRHKVSVSSGRYYQGIPDKVLVVRVILTFLSYDYIMDYVFHNNGAIEARVFSTGALITTAPSHADSNFGVEIDPFILANIHNHLFNYKVDLDIISVTNRHSRWRIHEIKESDSWSSRNSTKHYTLDKMTQELIQTEMEARYNYDFYKPEYLLFHTGKVLNKNEYPRSYRIILSGITRKNADDDIFKSLAWADTQMAVTIRKEYEETSSSLYALWDSIDPIVDFKKYINNDSIIDEDLIAWITLGFRHIPQMENVPSTITLGTRSSFLLTPFNFFDEDPSISSDDDIFFRID